MKNLLMVLLLMVSPVWAAAPFTPEQEARIKEIVRETMVSNPDILAQAVKAWRQQTEGQQVSQVIKKNAKTLYEDTASPRLGAKNVKLTLVSFTDYNCPNCKGFDPMLEKIVKQYPEVALVVKFLPYKGDSSIISARIALIAWQQQPERFWALHQRLMAQKGALDNDSIITAQKATNVAPVMPNEQSIKILQTTVQMAEQLGIQSTPATLIGDQLLIGAVPYEELESRVKQQLAKAKNG